MLKIWDSRFASILVPETRNMRGRYSIAVSSHWVTLVANEVIVKDITSGTRIAYSFLVVFRARGFSTGSGALRVYPGLGDLPGEGEVAEKMKEIWSRRTVRREA
jgi:hypothetical protein